MGKIPKKIREEIKNDPFFSNCALKKHFGHECEGRVTLEHAIIYAGKQLQQKWAIVPLCAKAHAVNEFQDAGTMNKELNVWVALNRATPDELAAISKVINYVRELDRLNEKYGVYIPVKIFPALHRKGDVYRLNWICKACETINLNVYAHCSECGTRKSKEYIMKAETSGINY